MICGESDVQKLYQPCLGRLYGHLFQSFCQDDRVAHKAALSRFLPAKCAGTEGSKPMPFRHGLFSEAGKTVNRVEFQ